MMKTQFKNGALVVPNGRIESAFIFRSPSQLIDGVEYKEATDSERIYYYKRVKDMVNLQEVRLFNEYKESESDYENSPESYQDEDFANFEEKMRAYQQAFER